jgi:hypothetical protein
MVGKRYYPYGLELNEIHVTCMGEHVTDTEPFVLIFLFTVISYHPCIVVTFNPNLKTQPKTITNAS